MKFQYSKVLWEKILVGFVFGIFLFFWVRFTKNWVKDFFVDLLFSRWMPIFPRNRVSWICITSKFRHHCRVTLLWNSCRVSRKMIRGWIFDLRCVIFCRQFIINIEFKWRIVSRRFMCEVFRVAEISMRGWKGMIGGSFSFRGNIDICLNDDIDEFVFEILSIRNFLLMKCIEWLILVNKMK